MSDLSDKRCVPCEGGVPALSSDEANTLLATLNGWAIHTNNTTLSKTFKFRNYHKPMAFVNAIAWMAHQENHHPALEVHYDNCVVTYTTHAIGGLSENDFICAAKIDELRPEAI